MTQALRSTGVIDVDTVVTEIEHDRIGECVGLMGDLARLTLRYRGRAHGAPSSLIMKVRSNLAENRGVGDHFNPDWQLASESAGVGDAAYVITLSMTVEDR